MHFQSLAAISQKSSTSLAAAAAAAAASQKKKQNQDAKLDEYVRLSYSIATFFILSQLQQSDSQRLLSSSVVVRCGYDTSYEMLNLLYIFMHGRCLQQKHRRPLK